MTPDHLSKPSIVPWTIRWCKLTVTTPPPFRIAAGLAIAGKNDTYRLMEREPIAADIVRDIPDRFWKIPYDVAHDRDSPTLKGIETGANCQNFAYELLRCFGRHLPLLRSSNLWDDTEHTIVVDDYQPLDLLLFNRTRNAWGAHVAVYVGNDRAIHLSLRVGFAAVWPLVQFTEHPEYRVLLGAKRALSTNSGSF